MIVFRKPGGDRPLGRPRCTSQFNAKMDLREIGWGSMDWVDLSEGGNRTGVM
jgi:hypothetical protein